MKGVTVKDALDAIHKQFKKKVSLPILSIQVPIILFHHTGGVLTAIAYLGR